MGVTFSACEVCGDTFPDCGDFERCVVCEKRFCCEACMGGTKNTDPAICDCGESKYYREKQGNREFNAKDCDCKICCFCTMDEIKAEDLLELACNKLGCTVEDLTVEYRELYKS